MRTLAVFILLISFTLPVFGQKADTEKPRERDRHAAIKATLTQNTNDICRTDLRAIHSSAKRGTTTARPSGKAAASLLALASLSALPSLSGCGSVAQSTTDSEMMVGKCLADFQKRLLQSQGYTFVENDEIKGRIRAIIDRLAQSENAGFGEVTTIEIYNSPQPNAFTTGGGTIFLTQGLFQYVENEEQLAAVLAHELGHIQGHHTARTLERQGASIILQFPDIACSAIDSSDVTTQNPEPIEQSEPEAAFDQTLEFEADQTAASILIGSPYSPNGLETFLNRVVPMHQRYIQLRQEQNCPIDDRLIDHPWPWDRITRLDEFLTSQAGSLLQKGSWITWPDPDAFMQFCNTFNTFSTFSPPQTTDICGNALTEDAKEAKALKSVEIHVPLEHWPVIPNAWKQLVAK